MDQMQSKKQNRKQWAERWCIGMNQTTKEKNGKITNSTCQRRKTPSMESHNSLKKIIELSAARR